MEVALQAGAAFAPMTRFRLKREQTLRWMRVTFE
jgi:hypothetical protein